MSTYGMKDASNLVFKNKRTGNIDLYLDYANATTSEWTSERVFATKKGTNAIAWDSNRTGTLTVDSEIFDLKYLAMILGSEVEKGTNNIMKREVFTVGADKRLTLKGNIEATSVSVLKLKDDLIEHDGLPLVSTTGQTDLLPAQVTGVSVAINDTTANITFELSARADAYEIKRNGVVIGTTTSGTFTDTGLTPATQYTYTIVATNEFGKGAESAVVTATTAADGVTTRTTVTATPEAITASATNVGELNQEATNMVTFSVTGNDVQLNDKAVVGEAYAVYFLEQVSGVRTIKIAADKFPDAYEVYADAYIREAETGTDEFVQIAYHNARPQSNFTLTQDVNTPTALSVVFDLFPDKNKQLAEYKIVD